MRFLADECLDNRLILGLRQAGHDVLIARDVCRGAPDHVVLELATRERRVLVTEDKDLGRLIVQESVLPPGVVLVRTTGNEVPVMLTQLLAAIDREGDRLHSLYIVVTEQRTRARPLGTLRRSSA